MPDPNNHNQLALLTSAQVALIDAALAGNSLQVSELVKIDWPSPDGSKVYSWWNCLADSAYTTPLTDWLGSTPLVPGFVATDEQKAERFHNIPRTAAISDDVVQMRFTNYGQTFDRSAISPVSRYHFVIASANIRTFFGYANVFL